MKKRVVERVTKLATALKTRKAISIIIVLFLVSIFFPDSPISVTETLISELTRQPNVTRDFQMPVPATEYPISGFAFENLNVEWLDGGDTGWTNGADVPCVRLTNSYINTTLTTHQLFVPDDIPTSTTPGAGALIQYNLEEWWEGEAARIQYALEFAPYTYYDYGDADLNTLLGNSPPQGDFDPEDAVNWTYYPPFIYYYVGDIVLFEGIYYLCIQTTHNINTPIEYPTPWQVVVPGTGSVYPQNFFQTGARETLAYDDEELKRVFDVDELIDVNVDFNVSWSIKVNASEGAVVVTYYLFFENSTTTDLVHTFQDIYEAPLPPLAETIGLEGLSVSIERDTPLADFNIMQISYGVDTTSSHTFDYINNTFTQHYDEVDMLFYPTIVDEKGALEFCVVLKEQPASNILGFTVEGSERLIFEFNETSGGYSVYYDNSNLPAGAFKREGKQFEIHRPSIIDSNNVGVYGDLNYSDNILYVTIPSDFLASASYPVYVDPVYGVITDAVVDSWEWDTEEGYMYNPSGLIRLGTSEYYMTSASGDTGSDTDGFLRVMKVWDDNGTFVKTLVDKWEYDITNGMYAGILHLVDDVYIVYYMDSANGEMFTTRAWSSNGTLQETKLSSKTYTFPNSQHLIHVDGDIYALSYFEGTGDRDHFLETYKIWSSNYTISDRIDVEEYDEGNNAVGAPPPYAPRMTLVDEDTIALVYSRNSDSDGQLRTFNISSVGAITAGDYWEFDTADGLYPYIVRIAGNVFAISYSGGGADGFVKTLTIADTGVITESWIDELEFDTTNCLYPSMFTVADAADYSPGVYGISYSGSGADGYLCTLNISNDGSMDAAIIDYIEFNTADNSVHAPCIHVDGNYYLIVYTGTGNDGHAVTVEIETPGPFTFGYTKSGTDVTFIEYNTNDYFTAIAAISPLDGYLMNITIKTGGQATGSVSAQTALYEYVNETNIGELLGTSDIVAVSAANTEYVFPFSTPIEVDHDTYYYLCVGGLSDTGFRVRLTGVAETNKYCSIIYANGVTWTDPMTGESFSDGQPYIYASCLALLPIPNVPPTINITFAGNLTDKGGPYWLPPGETVVINGTVDGYYTNNSRQHEDFIYINATVEDSDGTVSTVKLCLYNYNTSTWDNTSSFSQVGSTDYWNITKTVTTNHNKYTFRINATDNKGDYNVTSWQKVGKNAAIVDRAVFLNCSKNTNISYDVGAFYLWDDNYTAVTDQNKYDRLDYDGSANGGAMDTGRLIATLPTDERENRSCSSFVGYWWSNDMSIESFTLENIYFHTWALLRDDDFTENNFDKIGWAKSRKNPDWVFNDSFSFLQTEEKSNVEYDWGVFGGLTNVNFSLVCNLLTVDTPYTFTDNNIYEFSIKFLNETAGCQPMITCNRSMLSFVLFNVPDNATLNASFSDSDSDGLSDWEELYVTYTNPFLADTDNDGINDCDERDDGTDPNDYTDFNPSLNTLPELTNASVYPSSGIASYTTFYFNVTWADIDDESPLDGYLTVNITRDGWSTNQSMVWVVGSNSTGANYSYSTTLTAGSYNYTFWAYDGTDTNSSGPHNDPTVNSQSYAIGVNLCHPKLIFNMSSFGTMGTQANVPALGQADVTPALEIENQGNVPINLTIVINASPDPCITFKWDSDNNPVGATEVTTSGVSIYVNLAPSSTEEIWTWMDFSLCGPGTGTKTLTITSYPGSW